MCKNREAVGLREPIMDRCDEFMELLVAFMDRELGEPERARVEAHLDACADCRRELEALKRVDGTFRAAAAPEVSAREWDAMSAALDEAMEAPPVAMRQQRVELEPANLLAIDILPFILNESMQSFGPLFLESLGLPSIDVITFLRRLAAVLGRQDVSDALFPWRREHRERLARRNDGERQVPRRG